MSIGGENAPLLEDSADLAEAEQAETDRIRSEQMRAAAKRIAAGMPEPTGEWTEMDLNGISRWQKQDDGAADIIWKSAD